jgi:hypothetical protein
MRVIKIIFGLLIAGTIVCGFQKPIQAMRRVPVIGDSSKEISNTHQENAKPQQQNSVVLPAKTGTSVR